MTGPTSVSSPTGEVGPNQPNLPANSGVSPKASGEITDYGRFVTLQWALGTVLICTHLIGALTTYVLFWELIKPIAANKLATNYRISLAYLVVYLIAAVPIASAVVLRWVEPTRKSARSGHLSDLGRARILSLPKILVISYAAAWVGGAIVFGVINLHPNRALGIEVAIMALIAGGTTSALAYLIAERILRPITSLALEGKSAKGAVPGVLTRSILMWMLGTGGPVSAVVVSSAFAAQERQYARSVPIMALTLGLVSLVVGFIVTVVYARSISDPLKAVRQAMIRVGNGELDISVPVYDASEIGELQVGLNDMVKGLKERRQLWELYEKQVGSPVAEHTLRAGAELGGQERYVGILFVDIVGSTELAQRSTPTEVLEVLNAFFSTVVRVVDNNGGWVNKFEGDAALCVFGAPEDNPDSASAALRSARELQLELRRDVSVIRAAIGVTYGLAVAGHVGTEDRFEYTVLGDPVNEAARLAELAKNYEMLTLASGAAIKMSSVGTGSDEAQNWLGAGSVVLRGRSQPTELLQPRQSKPNNPVDQR